MRADAAFDRTIAKAARNGISGDARRLFKPRRVAGFDFITERRTVAVRESRLSCRRGFTCVPYSFD